MLVKAEDVWKRYTIDGPWVLQGVSIEASPGDMIAVVGSNGSGKTTLIKILAGLIRPSRGRVLIDGHNAGSIEAKRILGLVLHTSTLYPTLTVRENLQLYADLYGVRNYDPSSDPVVETLGLSRVLDQPVYSLSFGWRKRADLVRSLLHKPKVLLLDEPFTGLDERGVEDLLAILEEHTLKGGAVIATSPRGSDVPGGSFRKLRLVNGRIVGAE
ncbi:MAG: heme ABC exporter ATP-binding protein CcmA [Desulfurococcales archaeon]|nr:heme ABC exporter ATP-binding protein CcmA [Desulfurococcales archaeon]